MFLEEETDMIKLSAPTKGDYRRWCARFLEEFAHHYPTEAVLLGNGAGTQRLAAVLAEEYARSTTGGEHTMRLWAKLASLVPSLLFTKAFSSQEQMEAELRRIARAAAGEILPWEI